MLKHKGKRWAVSSLVSTFAVVLGMLGAQSLNSEAVALGEPGAPATCEASVQGSSVLVEWTPPASNGGTAITNYTVKVKGLASPVKRTDTDDPDGAGPRGIEGGAARSFVWFSSYSSWSATTVFQVRAVNSSGFGLWCETAPLGSAPTNVAPSVNAGADQSITLPSNASLDGTVSDDGLPSGSSVTSTWTKASGPGTVTFGDANAVDTTAAFSLSGTYVLTLTSTDGSLSSSDSVTITVAPAPVVTTVPDAPASCQASVQTDGTVLVEWTAPASDGGLPILRYAVKVKGTTTSAIQVNDPAARSYVYTGSYVASDIMQVRAVNSKGFGPWCETTITPGQQPTNAAPSVDAGVDQNVTLPASANLNGTVSDDGLPSGSSVSSTWTKVSGPGTVSFGNASAVDTTASFSTSGTYVLQLSATDGSLTSSDTVTVTVAPAAPVNQAPSVNAGTDQTVTLPNSASLDGTASDDGLPSGSSLTTVWSKVSGPGTVTFGDATAQDTTASFSVSGSYVLKLTASDGTLSSSDNVAITVNAAASGRPYIPYSSGAWMKQTLSQLGLSQNSTKTTAMRNYINASHQTHLNGGEGEPNLAPNIQGLGTGWGSSWGGVVGCSDAVYKIGTGTVPPENAFLKTTGFHATAQMATDLKNAAATGATDLPFEVVDRCGNSTFSTGFTVKGGHAVVASGTGTASNPYVLNVLSAGAYGNDTNGLDGRVPGSNGPNNWSSRGVIAASATIRADQVEYGIDNTSDLGQRLELFWWETDSAAGKISPPMAGFESNKSGWGAEGQVVGVNPSFVPDATCTPGEKVIIRTLQNYGAYIGDNAGAGGTSLKGEQNHGQWSGLGLSQQGLADDCGLVWNDFVAYG